MSRPTTRAMLLVAALFVLAIPAGFTISRVLRTEQSEAQAGGAVSLIPECMTYEAPSRVVRTTCFSGDPPESGWYEPLLEAERRQPFFDGTLAGIRIGPEVDPSGTFCSSIGADDPDSTSVIPIERTAGTLVEIAPGYLPGGAEAEVTRTYAEQCGGIPYAAELGYWIPPDLSIPRWGGGIWISRARGSSSIGLTIAADRAETGEIAGHPAAFFRPLTAEGFGFSAIAYSDGAVLTVLLGDGVSLDDLRMVAESLE